MQTNSLGSKTIFAHELKTGMWMVFSNPRFNCRVVDVSSTRDSQVKVHTDYGHGGEPATSFFETTDRIAVLK